MNGWGIGLKVDKKTHPTTAADTFQVWIDTRDTKTIHRANRYCHLFEIHPVGNSESENKAACKQHPIHRAQADAPLCDLSTIQLWTKIQPNGYELDVWFPASALYGFDPALTPQLGFYYAISDSELGDQFMIVDHEFPYEQDPSLWATVRLESRNKSSDES